MRDRRPIDALKKSSEATLDACFCVRAAQRAIEQHGVPEIYNTDQGSQFTSADFTQPLLVRGIRISMDGRGRGLDYVFIERLSRTVKYDEINLKCYLSQIEAHTNLKRFFRIYNDHRPHSAFGDTVPMTPMEVYRKPAVIALSA